MTDIAERLRQNARSEDCFTDPYPDVLTDAADEIDRLRARVADTDGAITVLGFQNAELRARVAELEAERDAAFKMSRCECDSEEACSNLAALHRKVAELEAARGEPVAYLHQVVCGDGEPDQALSFAPDNFPLAGVLGYRSLSHEPLYTAPPAPTVDVDAISEEAILRTQRAVWEECGRDVNAKLIRTVVDAIFNKGE